MTVGHHHHHHHFIPEWFHCEGPAPFIWEERVHIFYSGRRTESREKQLKTDISKNVMVQRRLFAAVQPLRLSCITLCR